MASSDVQGVTAGIRNDPFRFVGGCAAIVLRARTAPETARAVKEQLSENGLPPWIRGPTPWRLRAAAQSRDGGRGNLSVERAVVTRLPSSAFQQAAAQRLCPPLTRSRSRCSTDASARASTRSGERLAPSAGADRAQGPVVKLSCQSQLEARLTRCAPLRRPTSCPESRARASPFLGPVVCRIQKLRVSSPCRRLCHASFRLQSRPPGFRS
jgi:hypothetical protein